jgi:hypothetical protein
MKAEQVMVDHPFYEIKSSESSKHRPEQELVGAVNVIAVRVRQRTMYVQPWKTPSQKVLSFRTFDRRDRVPRTEHVVPLEDLMQDNPIKKSAEAKA